MQRAAPLPLLLLLGCLDVAEQKSLLSGTFCSKAVDYSASCLEEEL